MNAPLRVAIADDDSEARDYLTEVLPRLGCEVVAVASSGHELLEGCRAASPDLIITDVRMPDLDGIEAAAEVNRGGLIPVVLISAHHDQQILGQLGRLPIMGYLVKPFTEGHLKATLAVAMVRFQQFQTLRQEADDLRQALEDRKAIERAKGVLMRRLGLDEVDAYRRLRSTASSRNLKLIEVAKQVIAAETVLSEFDRG
ncbi:MAG: response regulator [Gemmataceae bacterium]